MPADPKFISPGFARASAMNSGNVFAVTFGLTIRVLGGDAQRADRREILDDVERHILVE